VGMAAIAASCAAVLCSHALCCRWTAAAFRSDLDVEEALEAATPHISIQGGGGSKSGCAVLICVTTTKIQSGSVR
jgi:hypothetical protein